LNEGLSQGLEFFAQNDRLPLSGNDMRKTIKGVRNFWVGLLFIAFGAVGIFVGQDYSVGAANRMGPGYFPQALSLLLMVLGGLSVIRAFVGQADALSAPRLKPTLLIIGSLFLCAYLLPRAGLIIGLAVMMLMASMASSNFHAEWKKILLLTLGTIVFCALIFVRLLGVSLPLLGSWFS
jgi:hypothetical protein